MHTHLDVPSIYKYKSWLSIVIYSRVALNHVNLNRKMCCYESSVGVHRYTEGQIKFAHDMHKVICNFLLVLQHIVSCIVSLYRFTIEIHINHFLSLEAGIANAISIFKRKYTSSKLNYFTNWSSTMYHKLYNPLHWHIIWFKMCLKPYIYRRSRRRVNIKVFFYTQ